MKKTFIVILVAMLWVFSLTAFCYAGEIMSKLSKGDKAPSFQLKDQDGNLRSLSDYKGKKLLLFFYPKADTPGCTKQSCSVSESLEAFKDAGVACIGVSPDMPKDQKKFDEKFKLGFPLLGDEDHAIAEAYGVWGEKSMYGKMYMGIIRSSFLIDEEGKIIEAWYKVSPEDTVPNAKKLIGK